MTSHRVLVTETIAEAGLAIFRNAADVDLDYRPGLKGDELLRAVAEADALITRSGTAVTPELVNAGAKLRVVGRATSFTWPTATDFSPAVSARTTAPRSWDAR